MKVELTKKDLICLLKGASNHINYGVIDYLSHVGKLTGFPNEQWVWNDLALNEMTEEQLFETYKHIATSI